MRRRPPVVLALLLAACGAGACGQKGPLTLPEPGARDTADESGENDDDERDAESDGAAARAGGDDER